MLGSVHDSEDETGNGSTSWSGEDPRRHVLPQTAGSDRPLAFEPGDEDGWHRLARGYRLAGLLLTAHRMGLLRALAGRGQTSIDQLSRELLADPQLLTMICRALRTAGLLAAGDDGWQLSPAGEWLATDAGASLELDAMAEDYQRWGQLELHARVLWDSDEPRQRTYDEADVAHSEQAARRYARRMTNRRRQQVDRLLTHVVPTRPLAVLDAWGGDGYVAREMCARWQQITCTVLEIPTMAPITREACAGYPRIAVITGDLASDDPGRVLAGHSVDVVVLSHVLQSLSEQRRRELVAQATRVLAPGGCLLSNEFALRWNDRDSLDVLLWAVGRTSEMWAGEPLRAAEQDMLLRGGGLAAVDAWWVTESTRAVLGVKTAAGMEPALRVLPEPRAAAPHGEPPRH
ncbi:MAG TPA: class I SAM-dependent methyltransferase [Euzebyales bacterium]|nr:class I SAM-dependent methyltransferase [Euzebyales bacterium]